MNAPLAWADLNGIPSMILRDVDAAREAIARIFGDLTSDIIGEPRLFEWRATIVALGPLFVLLNASATGGYITGTLSDHFLVFPDGGCGGSGTTRGEVTPIAEGETAAVFSPGPRMDRRATEAFSALGLRVEPRFLEAQLEALTGRAVPGTITFALSMRLDAGIGAHLHRLLRFIVEEASRDQRLLDQPVLAQSLCETLARALLVGQPHDHSHLLARPAPPSGRGTVRRVEDYLDAHAAEPIHVAELTALTGAPGRSIEAGFQTERGTTPAAFLRRKRLELARRALLSDPRVDPTRVARAAGFLRRERFEAAYARAFGESVAATRRRGRSAAAPATAAEMLAARAAALSPREREVCNRVGRGRLNKQIAAELGISESMVKRHRARGMARLGVTSTAEMAACLEHLRGAGGAIPAG